MKITAQEILHVADLARLELDAAAVQSFASQIAEILEYVNLLQQVDTAGVPPTTHAIFLKNVFRDDVCRPHLDTATALANAPEKEAGSFVVPRIIG